MYKLFYQFLPKWYILSKVYTFGFEAPYGKEYFPDCVERERIGDLKNKLRMIANIKVNDE